MWPRQSSGLEDSSTITDSPERNERFLDPVLDHQFTANSNDFAAGKWPMKEAFGSAEFGHDASVPFARPGSTKTPVATAVQSLVLGLVEFDAEIVDVVESALVKEFAKVTLLRKNVVSRPACSTRAISARVLDRSTLRALAVQALDRRTGAHRVSAAVYGRCCGRRNIYRDSETGGCTPAATDRSECARPGCAELSRRMFELAQSYRDTGMTAYARLQKIEFEREADSDYRAVKHQSFVGTGYFDAIAQAIAGGTSSTTALTGSTEEEQFHQATMEYPVSALGQA
jgi:hypothetical protein